MKQIDRAKIKGNNTMVKDINYILLDLFKDWKSWWNVFAKWLKKSPNPLYVLCNLKVLFKGDWISEVVIVVGCGPFRYIFKDSVYTDLFFSTPFCFTPIRSLVILFHSVSHSIKFSSIHDSEPIKSNRDWNI